MNIIRQEITIDSNYLREISLELAQKYISKTELRSHYNQLISNLQEYHTLCLDSPDHHSESIWLSQLRELFVELEKFDKYPDGQLMRDSLKKDFLEFFINGKDTLPITYSINNRDIKQINIEIAKSSLFKLLLSNLKISNPEIIKISPYDFYINYHHKNSILLRNTRVIHVDQNEYLMNFKFLSPYLYFANTIQIWDKYLLKDSKHIDILMELFSYIDNPLEIIIWTNYYEPTDRNVIGFFEEFKTINNGCKIHIKKFIKAHPRRILTNYSKIELTNTFDILEFHSDRWVCKAPICFTCTLIA